MFQHAEKLVGQHFRLSHENIKNYRYDVKTLVHLEEHEIKDGTFAHLCRYHFKKEDMVNPSDGFYFYRVCLQDNRILDAVDRGHSFIKLNPLLLYIAAHELIHIIVLKQERYFDASRRKERKNIKSIITRDMLKPAYLYACSRCLDRFKMATF